MSALDLAALRTAPCHQSPYPHVIVPHFVRDEALEAINADFPTIRQPGLFPLSSLSIGGGFEAFIDELEGTEFRTAIAEKLGVRLEDCPPLITVRGRCRMRDGRIHTDTPSKIVSVLIYLNRDWEAQGGRIRVLRSNALQDYAEEIPPTGGTLFAFRRSERSWHGHEPYEGERRVIQVNWLTDQASLDHELRRHRVSAFFKKLNPVASGIFHRIAHRPDGPRAAR